MKIIIPDATRIQNDLIKVHFLRHLKLRYLEIPHLTSKFIKKTFFCDKHKRFMHGIIIIINLKKKFMVYLLHMIHSFPYLLTLHSI